MASKATEAKYLRDGQRLLARSAALYPDMPELEALLTEAQEGDVLMAATIRRYRPPYAAAVDLIATAGMADPQQCDFAYQEICTHLSARKGIPDPLRTGAAKNLATKQEAEKTFLASKALALATKDPVPVAVALYVFVAPRIGIRPIELIGARLVGKKLIVRNAKRKPRQRLERSISLKRFAESFIEAVRWLIILANVGVTLYQEPERGYDLERAFELWRNKLASCLARISKEVCGDDRRLSLYSFRHIAIATWKAAGYSAETIAALAGHLLLSSAGRYYAPAKAGWVTELVLAEAPVQPQPVKDEPQADHPEMSESLEQAEELDGSAERDSLVQEAMAAAAEPSKGAAAEAGSWDTPMPEKPAVPSQPYLKGEDLFRRYSQQMEASIQASEQLISKARATCRNSPAGVRTGMADKLKR